VQLPLIPSRSRERLTGLFDNGIYEEIDREHLADRTP